MSADRPKQERAGITQPRRGRTLAQTKIRNCKPLASRRVLMASIALSTTFFTCILCAVVNVLIQEQSAFFVWERPSTITAASLAQHAQKGNKNEFIRTLETQARGEGNVGQVVFLLNDHPEWNDSTGPQRRSH